MMSDMFLKMVSSGDADKEGGELAAQAEAAPLRGAACMAMHVTAVYGSAEASGAFGNGAVPVEDMGRRCRRRHHHHRQGVSGRRRRW